jgi:copper chaperone CopZ
MSESIQERGKRMQKTYKVEGMMCGNCEARLTRVLKAVEGVNEVKVSYESGKVEIDFNDEVVNEAVLLETIEDAGFDI